MLVCLLAMFGLQECVHMCCWLVTFRSKETAMRRYCNQSMTVVTIVIWNAFILGKLFAATLQNKYKIIYNRISVCCLFLRTRAFINRLLCVDISQRLTALEALKEPWVCGRQLSALSPSQFSIRLSQSMNRSLSE